MAVQKQYLLQRERLINLISGSLQKLRILIEDIPDVRELLRALLEPEGHTVVEATNGQEAVAPFRTVIPTSSQDLPMLVMDGYGATRRIRRQTGATIPITAISSEYGGTDSSERALAGWMQQVNPSRTPYRNYVHFFEALIGSMI